MNELTTTEPSQAVSVLSVIERAAKDPTIDVEKMERLLAMAERMEQRNAVKFQDNPSPAESGSWEREE